MVRAIFHLSRLKSKMIYWSFEFHLHGFQPTCFSLSDTFDSALDRQSSVLSFFKSYLDTSFSFPSSIHCSPSLIVQYRAPYPSTTFLYFHFIPLKTISLFPFPLPSFMSPSQPCKNHSYTVLFPPISVWSTFRDQ